MNEKSKTKKKKPKKTEKKNKQKILSGLLLVCLP